MDTTTAGPQLVTHIHLDAPLPTLPEHTPHGQVYSKALVVARLHHLPIAVIELEVTPGVPTPPHLLAALTWPKVRDRVNEHLREDRLREEHRLDPLTGVTYRENGQGPRCRSFPTAGLSAGDVAVVIPTLGRSPFLADLVRSVLDGIQTPREIVVAHNDPGEQGVRAMLAATFPDAPVRLVAAEGGGAAHARNVGALSSDAPVLAFLDDDVEVDSHWLEGVLRGFGRAPDVGCVTGLILPTELEAPGQVRLQQFGGFDKGGRPALFDLGTHRVAHPLYPYLPGTFGSGANVAVRRDVFERLGGFDVHMGPGTPTLAGEDIDFLLRAVLDGGLVAYEPESLVQHHHRSAADRELHGTMFAYGAGLGAVLVKQVSQGRSAEIVRRLPLGVRYLLSPSSPKNARAREGYPATLRLAELAGLASAPVTYVRTRGDRVVGSRG